jgi:hypothetical protein
LAIFEAIAIGVALPFGNRDDETVRIAAGSRAAFFDDRIEAAHDHPHSVERHVLAHFGHRGVAHELLIGGVARLPVGIFEPGEDDLLVRLGINGLAEVGDFSFGNVAVP